MVPVSTTLACLLTLLITLVLPLMIPLVFAARHRKQGIPSAWLLGAAGFFVTQLLIRTPLLSLLSGQSWFQTFSREHLFAYAFTLAFTAGLFELAGRFAVASLLKKKLTWNRALAAGLGHGGIEAVLITGMTYVNNLLYIAMINSGALLAAAVPGAPGELTAQLEAIQTALLTTPASLFLLAGLERILAMICHTAMSVIVCRGVYAGHAGKAALLCLGIHTLIDLTAGISLLAGTALTQTAAYAIIYAILILTAALSLWLLRKLRQGWQGQE